MKKPAFDIHASLDGQGLVHMRVEKGKLHDKIKELAKYHPWFSLKFPHPKTEKVAHVDVALPMLQFYKDSGLSVGVDPNLFDYYLRLKAGQDERLELLKMTLWPYQEQGARRLMSTRRALVSDEMGLGKTLQVIAALRPGDGVTVICPASVKGHWAAEIQRARPDFAAEVVHGYQDDHVWPEPGHVRILNPHILPESPSEAPGFADQDPYGPQKSPYHPPPNSRQTVIVDEAHFAKNRKTALHQRTVAIAAPAFAAGGSVYAITATPVLNKPIDLWGVLTVAQLARDTFGSFYKFCHAFNATRGAHGMLWGKARDYVPEIINFSMIRRRKADVLKDLPPKIYRKLYIDPGELVKLPVPMLKSVDLETDLQRPIEELDTPVAGALAAYRSASAEAKIPFLLELIEDFEASGEPVVVFAQHRAPIEFLGNRTGWVSITGSTPPKLRPSFVERFQMGLLKGIALTIDAGGVGITLTRASNIILVDQSFTPALNEQAIDRLHRIGQKSSVTVTELVFSDGIDDRVSQICTRKVGVLESAGLDFSTRSVSDVADHQPGQ